MNKIPTTFQMLGHTISVQVIPKKAWQYEDAVGVFNPQENTIKVLKQRADQTHHAYWHECMHCALYFMNHKLYANEQFVDQLGGLLAQLAATAE